MFNPTINPTRGMPRFSNLSLGKKALYGIGAAAGIAGLGAAAGWFQDDPDGNPDKSGQAWAGGGAAVIGAGALTVGGIAAYNLRKPGAWAGKKAAIGSWNKTKSAFSSYHSNLSREFDAATTNLGKLKTLASRKLIGAGVGAAIGGAIGSQYDETGKGAAIGAAAGTLLPSVIKVAGNYSKMSHFGKEIGLPVALTALAVGVASGLNKPVYQNEAEASSDGYGGYDYAPPGSGAGQRARALGATGDIAFGLHNKRHG